jgi:hypothetical protein
MTSKSNWLDRVELLVCDDVYVYQADMICADDAAKIMKTLKKEGAEDTGDSDDFPQGPLGDGGGEADSPGHCGFGSSCENALPLPSGSKIGAPFGNPLTSDGIEYLQSTLVRNLLASEKHANDVGRLWAAIYNEHLDIPLTLLPKDFQRDHWDLPANFKKHLSWFHKEDHSTVMPELFTDLRYVYGGAASVHKTTIWRLEITPTGFTDLRTVLLPASEAQARSLEDMIREIIEEDAWN